MQSIIYEVELQIAAEIRQRFLSWLGVHVEEMLTFDGFVGAQVLVNADSADQTVWVRYTLTSEAALTAYEASHAPRMRSVGLEKFPNGFVAKRRVYRFLQAMP